MISVNYVGYEVEAENYTRTSRPLGSGDYLLLYFLEPTDVCLPDEVITAEAGSVILYEPGQKQDFSALRKSRLSFVQFSAEKSDMNRFLIPKNEVFTPSDNENVHEYIHQIYKEFHTRDIFFEDQADALLRTLFVSLSRVNNATAKNEATNSTLYRLFCDARCMMLTNCEKEWASTNMCQMVSLSRSQFYKYYEAFFGVSPIADLNAMRIAKAKSLLTDEEISVTDVALMCGYKSIHHFSRTFKEHVGMSPLQYVKNVTARKIEFPEV